MKLKPNCTPGASVTQLESGAWQLKIPPSPKGRYRLAQLDDYAGLPRKSFPWQPPVTISIKARVSSSHVPGTWGFGLWNDPFSLSLGLGGGTRRFPALPNAAWFFFASPENYLSFSGDKPAQGLLMQTFRSPTNIPAPILALGGLGFPLLMWPWMARKIRLLFANFIQEDAKTFQDFGTPEGLDATHWHEYLIQWEMNHVIFKADDQTFKTPITPNGPLGLVIWIDNQYAAFPPNGKLSFGNIPNLHSEWLEIDDLLVESGI